MQNKKRYYLEYAAAFTIAFVVLFYFCYAYWFYKANKTFMRSFDGLDQHYIMFVYIGNLLREFFNRLLIHQELSFPMWNMGIGYGSDVLTSLAAYLPDPFNWISVFFPGVRSQFGYCVMIVLKVYAAGVAFSYFCFYHKQGRLATLLGALTYMFSGTMYLVFVESFVINPMYIFPIVLVGVDQVWRHNRSRVYVLSLAFAFINYCYFAYMIGIFVFFYVLLLFAFEGREHRNLSFLLCRVWRFFLYSLVAAGLSMVVVLPNVLVLMKESRLGVQYYLPLLFDKAYYAGVLAGFTDFYSLLERDCLIGYGSLSLLSAILLFTEGKPYRKQKIIFLVLTLMLCVPAAGSFMNGFSYTASRWVFAYALCVAYIVTLMVPKWMAVTGKQKKILLATVLVYMALVWLTSPHTKSIRHTLVVIPVVTTVIFALAKLPVKYQKGVLLGACCVSLYVPAMNHFYFRSGRDNLFGMAYEVPRGYAYRAVHGMELGPVLKNLAGAGTENRYDSWGLGFVKNMSWLYGISGMDFYISMYTNAINTFHHDLALSTAPVPFDYHGLDRRSELAYLMNVQHFLINKKIRESAPFGFAKLAGEYPYKKERVQLYKASYANSLVHGFQHVLPMEAFKALHPYERQEALLKAVFVEGETGNFDLAQLQLSQDRIRYEISAEKGLSYQHGFVTTTQKDGRMHLKFPTVQDCELYLYVDGVAQNDINNGLYFYVQGSHKGKFIPSTWHSRYTPTNRTHMYGGKHTWLLNLGIVNQADEVVLTVPNAGKSSLKHISLYAKPVGNIKKNMENLPSISNDVRVGRNEITFTIRDDSYPYLLLSVPYSTGWKAYVDGKERTIRLADDAFMALPINKGDKQVRLTYRTPGLWEGLGITVGSIICYVLIGLKRKRSSLGKEDVCRSGQ